MAQHFSTANNSHFGYGDKLTSVTLINIVCSLDVAHCYAIDCKYLDSLVQRFKLFILLLFFSLFMGYLWLILVSKCFTQAIIWFHLHEYAKAYSILDSLYQKIEQIDEV